jgi:hypothetical protein
MLAALTEVSIHHDALEYIGLFAGLAGGLAALAALWFAVLSKRDAKRSANASERSANAAEAALAIAREEAEVLRAERERKAVFSVDMEAHAYGTASGQPPGVVALTIKVQNTGSRDAEHVLAKVQVPDSLDMEACVDHEGNIPTPGKVNYDRTNAARFWTEDLFIPRGAGVGQHLRIRKPPQGSYRISAGLLHSDLATGQLVRDWDLAVTTGDPGLHLTRPRD